MWRQYTLLFLALIVLSGTSALAPPLNGSQPRRLLRGSGGSEPTFVAIALGDWGGMSQWPYFTYAQDFVAKQMGPVAQQHGVQAILALGVIPPLDRDLMVTYIMIEACGRGPLKSDSSRARIEACARQRAGP